MYKDPVYTHSGILLSYTKKHHKSECSWYESPPFWEEVSETNYDEYISRYNPLDLKYEVHMHWVIVKTRDGALVGKGEDGKYYLYSPQEDILCDCDGYEERINIIGGNKQ